MMEIIFMLIVGVMLIFLGVMNVKGNISSIHWYNRTRITEETRLKYGKVVGVGTIIIGCGIILSAILNILFSEAVVLISGIITLATVIVGGAFMLYAQFKYNKGIF